MSKNKSHTLNISLKDGWSFKLAYEKYDLEYLRALLKLKRFIDCLDVSDLKWLNPYAIRISFQDGKSIFNTDYTESYNQHWSGDYGNLPSLESFYYNYLHVLFVNSIVNEKYE